MKLSNCGPVKVKKQIIYTKTTMVGQSQDASYRHLGSKRDKIEKKESQALQNFKNKLGKHD